MKFLWATALAGALLGCTKSNPRSCKDGTCGDPAYPFCDVDGALEGAQNVCIAVECLPGEFRACRDDSVIECNASGDNYDVERCERGCSDEISGCRLCNPNEVACTNGKVATCDSGGKATVNEVCPLGCFEDQPRCRRIVPSNQVGAVLDMVASPTDIDLDNPMIDTSTGTVMTTAGPVVLASTLIQNGTLRVFVGNNVRLRGGTITSTAHAEGMTGPAIAFAARGTITVTGTVRVLGGAGGEISTACMGGDGFYVEGGTASNPTVVSTGTGGGGNATAGARGGNVTNRTEMPGSGGSASGTDTLVPIRGGCASGGVTIAGAGVRPYGAAGGGAIQLSSDVAIVVDGVIDARGAQGTAERVGTEFNAYYGGGAGGGILLEAPAVSLRANAKLIAKGGGGGIDTTSPAVQDDSANAQPGDPCTPPDSKCGAGGNGAAVGIAATTGGSATYATGATISYAITGGGGGGLGRIRVNTPNASYAKETSVIEAGQVTTGTLATR